MGKFDLSKPADFASLTLSTASNALLQLTGLSSDKWDIQEGAYYHKPSLPVLFHVFKTPVDYDAGLSQITDTYGRRKVPFSFPYKDGQTTDDLGRKGGAWDFEVLFHGKNYKKAMIAFERELNDPKPGTLVHPIRGELDVVPVDWIVTHNSEEKKAAAMKIKFIEHSFNVSFIQDIVDVNGTGFKGAIANALSFLNKIANIKNQITGAIGIAQSLKAFINRAVDEYNAVFQENLVKQNSTFNFDTTSDMPGLLPVNQGGLGNNDTFSVVVSPNDPFAGLANLNEETVAALAAQQSVDQLIVVRNQGSALISLLSSTNNGQGALIFRESILDIKSSLVALQNSLEIGLKSSHSQILSYKVPRLMSTREVAFLNGLDLERTYELEILNPEILSTNFVPAGTILKVPLA